ncbi:MAG: hypothetical protein O7A08_11410 [SAR324 cluster bacterium]|nr:hypothetical protein [SAR324 cluster bacterium]
MTAQGNEEKRMYERRMDARRGAPAISTLEEIMEEPSLTKKEQNFDGTNQRFIERRIAIRRKVERELHDLVTA